MSGANDHFVQGREVHRRPAREVSSFAGIAGDLLCRLKEVGVKIVACLLEAEGALNLGRHGGVEGSALTRGI